MKLEEMSCSLELAKRLKELGVNKMSCFEWIKAAPIDYKEIWEAVPLFRNQKHHLGYPAFSVAELGELLPPNINSYGLCFDATSCATQDGIKSMWHATYADYNKKMFDEVSDFNLAECFAKLLIYLLENGVIKND